jgi:hypothetical protein
MRIRRNGTTTTQEDGVLIAPLESRMSSKSLQSGSEGGGGDGAARQPRRPPTLPVRQGGRPPVVVVLDPQEAPVAAARAREVVCAPGRQSGRAQEDRGAPNRGRGPGCPRPSDASVDPPTRAARLADASVDPTEARKIDANRSALGARPRGAIAPVPAIMQPLRPFLSL